MWRRVRKAAAVVVAVVVAAFVAAQLVRPQHTNPPTDPSHTLQSQAGASSPLVAVMNRSCGDCHSNATEWRWYTTLAPLSWLMARAVTEGRRAVNFSEWTAYSPNQRRALLMMSCEDARRGTMPMGPYTRFRPDAQLSSRDVEIICAAAREPEPSVANGGEPSRSER
jgi:heme-binding protein